MQLSSKKRVDKEVNRRPTNFTNNFFNHLYNYDKNEKLDVININSKEYSKLMKQDKINPHEFDNLFYNNNVEVGKRMSIDIGKDKNNDKDNFGDKIHNEAGNDNNESNARPIQLHNFYLTIDDFLLKKFFKFFMIF